MQARQTSPRSVWVNQQNGSPRMAETITLMPDENGRHWWHYSWGSRICEAEKIETATEMIDKVTRVNPWPAQEDFAVKEFQELNRSLAEFFDLLNRQPRIGVSQIAELAQLNVLITWLSQF
jgi:hypothetical protein